MLFWPDRRCSYSTDTRTWDCKALEMKIFGLVLTCCCSIAAKHIEGPFLDALDWSCSDGDSDSWDFGEGAGFYLNATQPKWKQYRMYDYIIKELPSVLKQFKELNLSKVQQSFLQA